MTPIIDIDAHFEPGGDWLASYPKLAAKLPKLDASLLAVDAIVGDLLRDVPEAERPPAAELLPPGLLTLFGNEKLAEAGRRKEFEGKAQFQVANLFEPAACAALPLYAFLEGHPFRIRYMTPLVAAMAIWAGIGIGLLRRWQLAAAMALIGLATFEAPPLDRRSPIVLEAQWDLPNSLGRQTVTACLALHYRGEPILMSMGSLAHYMQELSNEGFAIRDFVHEGNHPEWDDAIEAPQGRVGWILIEEQAEGGDVLSTRARQDPTFLGGFERICSGGGVALYEATESTPRVAVAGAEAPALHALRDVR